jgi:hypothetical protein
MGGDLGPGDRLAEPQTRREPRPFMLPVGLPRTAALRVANGRHQTVSLEAEGTGNEIYSESKTETSRRTYAEPNSSCLGGDLGDAGVENSRSMAAILPVLRSGIGVDRIVAPGQTCFDNWRSPI